VMILVWDLFLLVVQWK